MKRLILCLLLAASSAFAAPATSVTVDSSGNVKNTQTINFATDKLSVNGVVVDPSAGGGFNLASDHTFTGLNTFSQPIRGSIDVILQNVSGTNVAQFNDIGAFFIGGITAQNSIVMNSSTTDAAFIVDITDSADAFNGISLYNIAGTLAWSVKANGTNTTGSVVLRHRDGTSRIFLPASDTDSDRNTALLAAKSAALSGETIVVAPGGYTITTQLGKDGVNYHFEDGAILTYSANTLTGIFDDTAGAMSFSVSGKGSFYCTGTGSVYNSIVFESNVASSISFDAKYAYANNTSNGASAVFKLVRGSFVSHMGKIEAKGVPAANGAFSSCIYWERGPATIFADEINQLNNSGGSDDSFNIWANASAAPDGQLYVNAPIISNAQAVGTAQNSAIYVSGTDTSQRIWVQSSQIIGTAIAGGNERCINHGIGFLYVNTEKVIGMIYHAEDAASHGELHVTAQKQSMPTGNTHPAVYIDGGASYLSLGHIDDTNLDGIAVATVSDGTLNLNDTIIARTTTGSAIDAAITSIGCTVRLGNVTISGITGTGAYDIKANFAASVTTSGCAYDNLNVLGGSYIVDGNPNIEDLVTKFPPTVSATPAAPTVTENNGTGSITRTYRIVAKDVAGGTTAVGPAGSTTTGPTTLNVGNREVVAWANVEGARSYDVYRTAVSGGTPATTGFVSNTTNLSYNDGGAAGDGTSPPTLNTTGWGRLTTGFISPIVSTGSTGYLKIPQGGVDPPSPNPTDAIYVFSNGANKFSWITPAGTVYRVAAVSSGATQIASAIGESLFAATDAAAAKTALGLTIGTNVQAYDADLDALAALSGTHTIYYRSASNTWSAVTIGSGLDFTGATLTSTGGSGTVPVGHTTYVDAVNGDDGTGTAGRLDKPFLTIAAALAAASAGDTVELGPGTFTPAAVLVLPAGVSLRGAGIGVTIIDTGTHDGIVLSTGSILADLTIGKDGASNGTAHFPVRCTGSDTAFTSATMYRCKVIGNTDGLYFDKAGTTGFSAYDCIITTTFDTTYFAASGGTFDLYNCILYADGTIGGALNCRALNAGSGAIGRMYQGTITLVNPAATAAGAYSSGSGSRAELYGVRTNISASTPYDAQQASSGVTAISNVTRSDGAALLTNGSITQLSRDANRDNNLSDLASAATSRTNLGATTAGSNIFTLTNPSAISFVKIAADNTVSTRTPSQVVTDLSLTIGTNTEAWDADLDYLAGFTPSANVKTILNAADYAAIKTALSLTIGTNVQAYDADLTTYAGITPTTVAQNLLALTNPSAISFIKIAADNTVSTRTPTQVKTDLSLTIGTDVEAWDADLDTIKGLTATTDNFMVSVASAWASRTPTQVKTTLGLTIGTDVEAWDADLDTIKGLTATTDNFIVSVASAWASRTPTQVKTTLGLTIGTNVEAWDADLDYLAGFTPSANVKTILNAADYAAVKTALSLTIGTNVQAWDADLDYLAGFTPSANVKTILNAADYAAVKTALSLTIGTNVQAWDTQLDSLAGLSYTGNTLKFVRVNAGETGFELVTLAGGGDALVANPLSQFAATTSAQLYGVLSDETGSGSGSPLAVFNQSPSLVTPTMTTPVVSTATASTFAGFDGSKNLVSKVAGTDYVDLTGTPASGKIIYATSGTAGTWSTPTFPASASATNLKFIKSDGTNWVASTETLAAPGTSGNVATSDGTNWTSAAPAVIAPTIPTFVAIGTSNAGTGNATPNLPAGHTTNDILLLFVESANDSVTATPATYTQLNSQMANVFAATTALSRLTIFWKRDGGSESDPTVTDTGDHTYAQMMAIRGCPTSGDPFQFMSAGAGTATSTTLTATGGQTMVNNCLVVVAAIHNRDDAAAQYSAHTNADLGSVTERVDEGTASGIGGGLLVVTGTKVTAGSVGNTTVTVANTVFSTWMTFAMLPANLTAIASSPRQTESAIYIGSSNAVAFTSEVWNKPTGAKYVDIVTIGGGGAGGAGRSAATACGTAGGGGGAYARKTYLANDLPATLTISPGKAGIGAGTKAAATASTVTAGSNIIQTAGFGGIGGDATTGASGVSGPGGSVDVTTVPAAANPAVQGIGGQGAGGVTATAGIAGAHGEMGGGSGGTGNTTNAAPGTGGASTFGGGAGGGGDVSGTGATGGKGGAQQAGGAAHASASFSGLYTLGGSGGGGGDATTLGGFGAIPGGGGGGGGNATGSGGDGGAGVVVITTTF